MPFGLLSALRIFTKFMHPITAFCHHLGIQIIFYMDDSIIMARSRELALQHRDLVLSLLDHLGFLVNLEKSNLVPTQSFTFLGLHWDTRLGQVALTSEKILRLQSLAFSLHSQQWCLVWSLQKFLRHTNFAAFVVPHTRLHSHELHRVLSSNYKKPSDHFRWCILSDPARPELLWWQDLTVTAKALIPPTPNISMASDAFRLG